MAADSHFLSSCKNKIDPLLEALENLRMLDVVEKRVAIPTVFLIGDHCSGKTSVLESLTGLSLRRVEGSSTKAPLVLKLQEHRYDNPKLFIEFRPGKPERIENVGRIPDAVEKFNKKVREEDEAAVLKLAVRKRRFLDMEFVELPGIAENMKEWISNHLSKGEECLILNVVSAETEFAACQSTQTDREIDETGRITLSVFTKCDKAPNQALIKVLADNTRLGIGCVSVVNKSKEKQSQLNEGAHFKNAPLVKIPSQMAGFEALTKKLLSTVSQMILSRLPNVIQKIGDLVDASVEEKMKLPPAPPNAQQIKTDFADVTFSIQDTCLKYFL